MANSGSEIITFGSMLLRDIQDCFEQAEFRSLGFPRRSIGEFVDNASLFTGCNNVFVLGNGDDDLSYNVFLNIYTKRSDIVPIEERIDTQAQLRRHTMRPYFQVMMEYSEPEQCKTVEEAHLIFKHGKQAFFDQPEMADFGIRLSQTYDFKNPIYVPSHGARIEVFPPFTWSGELEQS